MSYSLQPHGLYSPWSSPGQNTGVGSCSLLQGIFPTQELNTCLSHCRQILYQLSHQGSLRILEWVAYPLSKDSPRIFLTQESIQGLLSCVAGGFFTSWATREFSWGNWSENPDSFRFSYPPATLPTPSLADSLNGQKRKPFEPIHIVKLKHQLTCSVPLSCWTPHQHTVLYFLDQKQNKLQTGLTSSGGISLPFWRPINKRKNGLGVACFQEFL